MEALMGVLIGGLVTIVTTVVTDHVRAKRDLKYRWDIAGLDAVAEFIEVVNRAIGALYDEGVSRFEDPASEQTAQRDRASRAAMDAVRVSHAKARLVVNPLSDEFASYYQSLDRLKAFADLGFPHGDEAWKSAQATLRGDLDLLLKAAGNELQIRVTNRSKGWRK